MTQTGQSVSSLGLSLASWVRLSWTNFLAIDDEVCRANTKAPGRRWREETGEKTAAIWAPGGVTALEPEQLTIF